MANKPKKKAKVIKTWAFCWAGQETYSGWVVFGPRGDKPKSPFYRNTLTNSKRDSLADFQCNNKNPWNTFYRKGYRVKRITVIVEG
jgi:hypothetical protein